ncbi:MAG: GNAT family N-acetyltransferase [Promethearchaeota archaeon]
MNKIDFKPFPVLKTERLILRQLQIEDEADIFALHSDESVLEFIDTPKANSLDEARDFIHKTNDGITKNEWIMWGIVLSDTNKLVGTICIWNISKKHSKAEIGYVLLPEYQGKGIMQEALTKVLHYGFEAMQLHAIEAYTHPKNLKSINLLDRNKFIWIKDIKENNSTDGRINSVYRLLKSNFL